MPERALGFETSRLGRHNQALICNAHQSPSWKSGSRQYQPATLLLARCLKPFNPRSPVTKSSRGSDRSSSIPSTGSRNKFCNSDTSRLPTESLGTRAGRTCNRNSWFSTSKVKLTRFGWQHRLPVVGNPIDCKV